MSGGAFGLRALYDRTLALAAHPRALWWLAAVAFCESFIFPIPQDAMMIPMILATPRRAWRIAAVATAASAAGGLAGYAIGAGLYESVARPLLALYGYNAQYASFQHWYEIWGGLVVAAGAFTPLPYKVITIASGAAGMEIGPFLIAAVPARAVRFFLLAWLLARFGGAARRILERHFGLFCLLGFLLTLAGFALLRVL